MRSENPRFTLRISKELMTKLGYIANNYGRTKNKEIEQVLKKYVGEYERLYGMPGLEEYKKNQ